MDSPSDFTMGDRQARFTDRMDPQNGYSDRMHPQTGYSDRINPHTGFPDRMDHQTGYSDRMGPQTSFPDRRDPQTNYSDRMDSQTVYSDRRDPQTSFSDRMDRMDPQTVFPDRRDPQTNFSDRMDHQTVFSDQRDPQTGFPEQRDPQTNFSDRMDHQTGFSEQSDLRPNFTERINPETGFQESVEDPPPSFSDQIEDEIENQPCFPDRTESQPCFPDRIDNQPCFPERLDEAKQEFPESIDAEAKTSFSDAVDQDVLDPKVTFPEPEPEIDPVEPPPPILSERIEYNLEGHQMKLMGLLYCHWLEQSYCDLKLRTANGGILRVHTSVVVAFSPRIATAISDLQDRFDEKGRVCKRSPDHCIDVQFDHDVVKSIMDCMYSGIFSAETADLDEMLQALEWLGIEELIDVVKRFRKKIGFENLMQRYGRQTLAMIKKNKKESQKAVKSKSRTRAPRKRAKPSKKVKVNNMSAVGDMPGFMPVVKTEAEDGDDIDYNSVNFSEIQEEVNQILAQKGQPQFASSDGVLIDSTDTDMSVLQAIGLTPVGAKPNKKRKSSKPKRAKKKAVLKDPAKIRMPKKKKVNAAKEAKKKLLSDIFVEKGNGEYEPFVKTELPDDFDVMQLPKKQRHLYDESLFLAGKKDSVKCHKCKVLFTDLEYYKTHIKDHPTFTCDKCFSVFFTSTMYCRHVRQAHLKQQHLKCNICDFTAKDCNEYTEHSINVHQEYEPFRCQHEGCTYKTSKYRYLTRHFVEHESFRVFKCERCQKQFKSYVLLHSHKKSCYQLQAYLCDLCGRSFNHLGSMKIHRRTMHSGEKPHKCSMCVKTFSDPANLRRHLRIHTNSYPYTCTVCGQQFRHSNMMKTHIMSKHGSLGGETDITRNANVNVNRNRTPRRRRTNPAPPPTTVAMNYNPNINEASTGSDYIPNGGINYSMNRGNTPVNDDMCPENLVSPNLKALFHSPAPPAQSFTPLPAHQFMNYTLAAASNLSNPVPFVPPSSNINNNNMQHNNPPSSTASFQPAFPMQEWDYYGLYGNRFRLGQP